MKIILQRVTEAKVTVDKAVVGCIKKGLLIFIGIGQGDTKNDVERLAEKIAKLRIFSDENDKINLSVNDVEGSILVVSQFTLYADCRKGNRPNFTLAENPEVAKQLYELFILECKKYVLNVQTGKFGADMKVDLQNDGPFTIILE